MRLARIEYRGEAYNATVTCNGYLIEERVVGGSLPPGTVLSEEEVLLLPPVAPGKILAVACNFRAHIDEMADRLGGYHLPTQIMDEVTPAVMFLKPPSSLIGHRGAIVYPKDATRVEYEGELAVVIARQTRRVTPAEAREAILGWTCANDVTERDQQGQDGQWWRAKGYDTFAVAGPYIETETPKPETWIRTHVNGELRQEGQVLDMIRDPFTIISIISQAMTLQRGDLIMLGTPEGVGELHPSDEVEVDIDGVGWLKNSVQAE